MAGVVLFGGGCRQHPDPVLPDPSAPDPGRDPAVAGKNLQAVPGLDLRRETWSETGKDLNPDLSPDGKLLVFASSSHGRFFNIFYKEVGSEVVVQKTTTGADDLQPRFSPDGKTLAYTSFRNGNWDLFTQALSDGAEEQLQTWDETDEIHPAWSPEGNSLAYSRFNDTSDIWELWSIEIQTKTRRCLAPGIPALFPDWSPAGRSILFQRPRDRESNFFELWTVGCDGSHLARIYGAKEWGAINPTWSPDGGSIVFASVSKSPESRWTERQADDLWMVKADGTGLSRLTADPSPEWNPVWSVTQRIFFVSGRERATNIWSIKAPARFPGR